ncbi:unnamed protein product [Blepharisma stoltei]|uniref:Ammonium transporter AmtB-like domain-containing protein n=1 Tax=Blepharisma stoltei TaxID=1481888 RepID=A0AAU9J3S6_9CILI|nr:unnamed protein product [Blepharisma stoltei]
MMEYGICRKGFGNHIIVKNWLQFSIGFAAWWLVGYGFAFGDPYHNEFIGRRFFGGDDWLKQRDKHHGSCASFFGLAGIFTIFIVNCAIAEKVKYLVYPFIAFAIMAWIWPVVVAWNWGGGWLYSEIKDVPMIDLGGTITVFLFAGSIAYVAAILTGKRLGRFDQRTEHYFYMESHVIYVLGATLTMLGIFGLTISLAPTNTHRGIGAINSWICGSLSAITAYMLMTMSKHDLHTHYIAIYQGFIAGQVMIASSAFNSAVWQAGIVGVMSGVWFTLFYTIFRWMRIDDTMNVSATFGAPAFLGGFLPGFITDTYGIFWQESSGHNLAAQVVGVFTIMGWAMFWAIIVFLLLRVIGMLILDDVMQKETLEGTEIGMSGYYAPGTSEKVANAD